MPQGLQEEATLSPADLDHTESTPLSWAYKKKGAGHRGRGVGQTPEKLGSGVRLATLLCRMKRPVTRVCGHWVLPANEAGTAGLEYVQPNPKQRALDTAPPPPPVCGESPWLKMRTEAQSTGERGAGCSVRACCKDTAGVAEWTVRRQLWQQSSV